MSISEAFVAVRPDLSQFANELRVGLPKEIAKVGLKYRQIELVPVISSSAKIALQKQLSSLPPFKVQATLELAPGQAAAIRKQLGIIENVPVGVTLAGAQTAKVTKQVKEAALAGSVAAEKAASTAAGATGVVPATVAAGETASAKRQRETQVKAQTAATERLLVVEREFAAVQAGIAAGALNEAAAEQIAKDAKVALRAETSANIAVGQERLAQINVEATRLAQLTIAEREFRAAQASAAAVPGAGANQSGVAQANAREKAAASAADAAETSLQSARLTGNRELIASNEALVRHIDLLERDTKKAKQNAIAQQEQRAASTQITRIEGLVDNVRNPGGATDLARAQAAARSAVAANKAATAAVKEFTAANSTASEVQIARLTSLEALTAALRQETAAELENQRIVSKSAASQSAATRGALATSASFLGLRGAVLASTLPFLAATVAVTTFGKAIKQAASLEQELNVFQAVSGATAGQLLAIRQQATALGADLTLPATSANDAATAMTQLAKAGLTVNDTLAASKGVLQLAAAANISAGDAATITATQLNAFNLAGSEAVRVTDLLAGASIAAQGEIGDFALAFQQVAAVAKQVDLTVDSTTGALTELAKAGLRGSDAGTSLRTFLLRLVPTTNTAASAQASLGVQIDKTASIGEQLPKLIEQYRVALQKLDPIQRQQILTQIFGQDAIRAASIIFGQAQGELQRITDRVSEQGTGARLAEARMKGLAGATEGFSSSAQTLGAELGETLVPTLTAVVEQLSSITQTATGAAQALKAVADVTIKPFGNALGGTDVLAQVGLAVGAGFGAKALIARRRRTKAAGAEAAAQVAAETRAAAEVAGAWVRAEDAILVQSTVTHNAQITGARSVAAAEQIAARETATAWGTAVGQKIAQTKRFALTNKLLLGSIGATLLGDQVGGQAGGALSTIGTTTALGAVVGGVPGALIGAGVGTFIAGLESGKGGEEKAKAAWDKLSFSQQHTYIVGNPKQASAFIEVFNLKVKPNPFDNITAGIIATLPTFAPGSDRTTSFVEQLGAFLRPRGAGARGAAGEAVLATDDQLRLNIQLAKLSGSTVDLQKALKAQAARDRALITSLQNQLTAPNADLSWFKLSLAERKKIAERIGTTIQDLNQTLAELATIANEPFKIATSTTIAGIEAGATKTLADDLRNARDVVAAYEKELSTTSATGDALDQLRVNLAEARARVSNVEQQIEDNNAAEIQKKKDLAKQAREHAEDNNAAEIQKKKDLAKQAREHAAEIAKLNIDLQNAILDTQLAVAQTTPGKADDKKALQAMIASSNVLVGRQKKKIVATSKKFTEARLLALIAIQSDRQKIISLKQQIKDLANDSGGGFSLNDLFKEAQNQFNQFASNVSSSPTTAGGVRGALAGGILAQKPGGLTPGEREQIGKVTTTNDLLTQILVAVKENGVAGKPKNAVAGTTAGADTAIQARRFARNV